MTDKEKDVKPTEQEELGTCPHCGRRHVKAHLRQDKETCPDCGKRLDAPVEK